VQLSVVVTVLGAVSTLLILYRIIKHPTLDVPGAHAGIKIGIWLGLIAAGALTYGGYLAMQDEGTSLGDVPGQAGSAMAGMARAPRVPPARLLRLLPHPPRPLRRTLRRSRHLRLPPFPPRSPARHRRHRPPGRPSRRASDPPPAAPPEQA